MTVGRMVASGWRDDKRAAASSSGCKIAARRDAERTPEHRCKGARAVIAEVERDMGHRLARREAGQADEQQRLSPPGAEALADFPGKQPGEVALADTGGARTVRDRSIRNRLREEAPQLQRALQVPPTALPYPILWRLSRPSQSRAAPCSAWPDARPHGLRSASRTGRTQVLRAERSPLPTCIRKLGSLLMPMTAWCSIRSVQSWSRVSSSSASGGLASD